MRCGAGRGEGRGMGHCCSFKSSAWGGNQQPAQQGGARRAERARAFEDPAVAPRGGRARKHRVSIGRPGSCTGALCHSRVNSCITQGWGCCRSGGCLCWGGPGGHRWSSYRDGVAASPHPALMLGERSLAPRAPAQGRTRPNTSPVDPFFLVILEVGVLI